MYYVDNVGAGVGTGVGHWVVVVLPLGADAGVVVGWVVQV